MPFKLFALTMLALAAPSYGEDDPFGKVTEIMTTIPRWDSSEILVGPDGDKFNNNVFGWIDEVVGPEFPADGGTKLELLYRGTRDGFDASEFHSRCDNQGATIMVVKSESGYVFGGVTGVAWASVGSHVSTTKAFLYGIRTHGSPDAAVIFKPTRYTAYAMYDDQNSSPRFGKGHDLVIHNNANATTESYANIGGTYTGNGITDESDAGRQYFAGADNFKVNEIEVFKIAFVVDSNVDTTPLPQTLLCNGTPDPSNCTVSECGTILFGSTNASSLCPAMCNACTVTTTAVPAKAAGAEPLPQDGKKNVGIGSTDTEGTNNRTDNGEEEADDPTTPKPNVVMIVCIVLPLLIFIGIGVAVFSLRKKEQGRQRSFTHSRGPPARNNPTFDFKEAAAAANAAGMSDYEEIDENDEQPANAYEQPANAYEQPVAQQPVSQVDGGMYEMPDSRTNQYADMGLGLSGDGPAPNRSAVANATYGNTAPEGTLYDEASNHAAAGQGVLYDAASASGHATYSLAQNDAGQQQQQQSYDAASADSGQAASYSMAAATVQGAVYDQAAPNRQALHNLAGAEDDIEGIEL